MNQELGSGVLSTAFKERGIHSFIEACEWIRQLPYKRNNAESDPFRVIHENCGTCSSKHELIKRLAEENGIANCSLVLCMFRMNGSNTPKVKSILELNKMKYIPEAHTYITMNGEVQDYTFPDNPDLLYLKDVIYTEEITAEQIKKYKSETHKRFIQEWIVRENISKSFQEIWIIRESCIQALSN